MVKEARAILSVMVIQNAIRLESHVQTSVVMMLNSEETTVLKTVDTRPSNMNTTIIIK